MLSLKYFVLFSALFLTVYSQDCPCWDEKTKNDLQELKDFLLKLKEDKYPVVPGELSPLVCNCIPKDRKKRKIVEMPQHQTRHQMPKKLLEMRHMSYNGRIRCAYGHRLIPVLNICVEM